MMGIPTLEEGREIMIQGGSSTSKMFYLKNNLEHYGRILFNKVRW